MMPLCISSSPILGPTNSVPRSSYLSPIASSTSLIATCWHHSARCSGVMSILAVLVVAARQLALEDGEADAAHRIAPAGGVERAGRGELDVAGAGRAGLDAPAVAGALLHDAVGVGHALRRCLPGAGRGSGPCWRRRTPAARPRRRPARPRCVRSSSRWAAPCLARTWMAMPPSKSMPKLRPTKTTPSSASDVDRRRQDERELALAQEVELGVGAARGGAGFHSMAAPQITAVRWAAASAPRRPAACG